MARSRVSAYLASAAIVALCLFFGGWPWAVISILSLVLAQRVECDAKSAVYASFLSLLWLGFFVTSGDRRLFFPFSIQYALQASFAGRKSFSAIVVAAFLAIRVIQAATVKVLTVELAVAIAVLGISLVAYGTRPHGWPARLACAAFGSFLAFLGLSL